MNSKTKIKVTSGRTALWPAAALALALGANASADPWKFGVMSDTQWTCSTDPAGQNPNKVSVSIINQLNQQFINQGVKFVIQVGDLTENGADADIAVRAQAAQPLYLAGIGFFGMRGNHETYTAGNSFGIPAFQANFPQTRGVAPTWGAVNFSSPVAVSADLNGMSYSFDFGTPGNKVRFVVLDDWVTPSKNVAPGNGYNYGYSIADQQPWLSGRLDKNARGTEHAFVFSHQNLIGENHQDSLFTGSTAANPGMQNAFFASLQDNGVKYYISGHDHIHQRSIITSPDGLSAVQEFICASDSSKFYTPKALTDANWFGQKVRETSLSQELYTVGYYIYTIDGPRVTVDFYSDDHGNWQSDNNYPLGSGAQNRVTPTFHFVKKETYGYSRNGIEIRVTQGGSYQLTDNTSKALANGETGYLGTTAQILAGSNGSLQKDYNARPLTKVVNTGWSPCEDSLASDVLSLWGLADLGANATDVFALSVSFNPRGLPLAGLASGWYRLLSKDAAGHWINAVDANLGGTPKFVFGPWEASDTLGTYGIDPTTRTAWAVINHLSDHAVNLSPAATPRAIQFGVLAQLQALRTTVTDRFSAPLLDKAIASVIDSLQPSVWIDDGHLSRLDGQSVFLESLETVNLLTYLARANNGLAAVLQPLIADEVVVAQTLASNTLAPAGVNRTTAQRSLAAGDARTSASQAIPLYLHAWDASVR